MVSGQHPQQEPGGGGGGLRKTNVGLCLGLLSQIWVGPRELGELGFPRFFLSLLASLLLPSSARGQLAL